MLPETMGGTWASDAEVIEGNEDFYDNDPNEEIKGEKDETSSEKLLELKQAILGSMEHAKLYRNAASCRRKTTFGSQNDA